MIETESNIIDEDEYCKLAEIVQSIEELKIQNNKLNNVDKEVRFNDDIIDKYKKLSQYKTNLLNENIYIAMD